MTARCQEVVIKQVGHHFLTTILCIVLCMLTHSREGSIGECYAKHSCDEIAQTHPIDRSQGASFL